MTRILGEGPRYVEVKIRPKEPLVYETSFNPRNNTRPDSVAILLPPLLFDPRDHTMTSFGQEFANRFGMTAYTMGVRMPKGFDHSPRSQAGVIAERVKTLIDEKDFKHITVGGISQGGNIAKSLAAILIHQYGLPVETLMREHARGDDYQSEVLLAIGYAGDVVGTAAAMVFHPSRMRNIPKLNQLLRDSYRGLRRALHDGTFRQQVRACVGINPDGREIPDSVVVYSRHGEKDSLSPYKHIVTDPTSRERSDRVAAHMRKRYGSPWIIMQVAPGGRHSQPFTDSRETVRDAHNAIAQMHERRKRNIM